MYTILLSRVRIYYQSTARMKLNFGLKIKELVSIGVTRGSTELHLIYVNILLQTCLDTYILENECVKIGMV